MRITGLGHAGMFIETTGGSILCDPVVKPSFYGSWFVFPDNRALDWERIGSADYLYISHRHRDHFDPWLLETYVRKDIGYGIDDDSIFTDQRQFLAHMAQLRPEQKGYEFVPGTVVELNGGEISVTQTLYTQAEIDRIFDDKWAYPVSYTHLTLPTILLV